MKKLRNFIYGRKDVVKNMREYCIFQNTTDCSYEAIRELVTIFSTEDPGSTALQRLGEFFVYFALPDTDDWVFGKGLIEHRGDYYSYIFHGVLLNDQEREELFYNPFLIADQLNPEIKDNRNEFTPVRLPEKLNYYSIILKSFNQITDKAGGGQLSFVGAISAQLLIPFKKIIIPYYNVLKRSYIWILIFFLIPEYIRKSISLSTFDLFLVDKEVRNQLNISGTFNRDLKRELKERLGLKENEIQEISMKKSNDTFIGKWWSLKLEKNKEESLRYYFDAITSLSYPPESEDHFKRVLQVTERPSENSLTYWPKNTGYLIKWKIKHFKDVWERNERDLKADDDNYQKSCVNIFNAIALFHYESNLEKLDNESKNILKTISKKFTLCLQELKNTDEVKSIISKHHEVVRTWFPDLIDDNMLIESLFTQSNFQQNSEEILKDLMAKDEGVKKLLSDNRLYKFSSLNIHRGIIYKSIIRYLPEKKYAIYINRLRKKLYKLDINFFNKLFQHIGGHEQLMKLLLISLYRELGLAYASNDISKEDQRRIVLIIKEYIDTNPVFYEKIFNELINNKKLLNKKSIAFFISTFNLLNNYEENNLRNHHIKILEQNASINKFAKACLLFLNNKCKSSKIILTN
ncbi:hypothetical protein GMMP15_90029 [Candidatus Magnetomoraceae bacterium gMMP-15]